MIANPYMTKSDSFYFVENELVMHHKAEYAYNAPSVPPLANWDHSPHCRGPSSNIQRRVQKTHISLFDINTKPVYLLLD